MINCSHHLTVTTPVALVSSLIVAIVKAAGSKTSPNESTSGQTIVVVTASSNVLRAGQETMKTLMLAFLATSLAQNVKTKTSLPAPNAQIYSHTP